MEFGYFTLSDNHYDNNTRSANQFVADITAEALHADTLGMHSAWIGEHHFNSLGVLSCPDLVLAYIAESGNLNAAARRLGLHRNTTLYKLDRVSRVLGMDIRSADTLFMVWLAHHIDNLVQVNDSLDAELAPPP